MITATPERVREVLKVHCRSGPGGRPCKRFTRGPERDEDCGACWRAAYDPEYQRFWGLPVTGRNPYKPRAQKGAGGNGH